MSVPTLPRWAESGIDTDGIEKVFVNPSIAYPHYLSKLGLESVDQYGVEIAFRCTVQQLKELFDESVHIQILPVATWALRNLPPGRGLDRVATDFAQFYARLTPLQP